MSASRVVGLIIVSSWLAAGCSSAKKIDVGGACILNSDCTGSLVCTGGKCHDQCHTSADCPAGQSCVKTSDSVICQLPAETSCSGTSSCGNGLTCAPDQHCRASCANCTPGQVCASNFCADPNDPDLVNGQLPPTPGSDAGTYDASSPDLSVAAPADAPSAVTGPEAGVPLDTSAGPDAPAVPLDGAGPDLAHDLAVSPRDATEAGLACTNTCDDGLSCTTDTCVAGSCQSTLKPNYCLIDKTCYMDGDTDPNDPCQACTITASTSLWTPAPEGARCGIGKSCQSHACSACGNVGQACCGTAVPGTCVVGAACIATTNQCQADKAIDISGGGNTFCALLQSGQVRCWGNSGTQLGVKNGAGSNVAASPVVGLDDGVQVSVGYTGSCAVRATGAVICWGNPVGTATTYSPVAVAGISNAKQVSVGYEHACVRTADSKILCWGSNTKGQFGNGTTTPASTPTQMSDVSDALKVAACGEATCVLRLGGQIACSGLAGANGQTMDVSTAINVPTVADSTDLSCSWMSPTSGAKFCALSQAGTLWCWGSNYMGSISQGAVTGLGQILLAAGAPYGDEFYLAIQQDHTLWALGDNSLGQLGDGTFAAATFRTSPRLAHVSAPLAGVVAVAIATDWNHSASCLLRGDGAVSCAGDGPVLGDGQSQPAANRTPFVPVVGILPVASEDGQCYDGVDNDGNGKTDLDDPACAQDLGSATGKNVATVPFAGIFGNYLGESCNVKGSSSGNFGGPEAVLVWTAPSGGTYQFDTSGTSFDTVLAAYRGNPQTAAELACNDDGATLLNGASAIQVKVVTDDKLTLVVDSKAASVATDSFTLNITKQ